MILPVERVIGEEGLWVDGEELRLAIRLPWYRSLPLSTVEIAALTVDGAPIPLADVAFEYQGVRWPLAEIGERTDVFWFVMDSAFLIIPARLVPGARSHAVALRIALYPPYIPGMRRENGQEEVLAVQETIA